MFSRKFINSLPIISTLSDIRCGYFYFPPYKQYHKKINLVQSVLYSVHRPDGKQIARCRFMGAVSLEYFVDWSKHAPHMWSTHI